MIVHVRGGWLVQKGYHYVPIFEGACANVRVPSDAKPSTQDKLDILLAHAIGSTSNSNSITLVKDGMLLGNGVGQQSRVDGAKLAILRALNGNHNLQGAAAYSDSFFPFNDGPQALIDAGISAIFATSGSRNDDPFKVLCNEKGICLIMAPDIEARGFCGHLG